MKYYVVNRHGSVLETNGYFYSTCKQKEYKTLNGAVKKANELQRGYRSQIDGPYIVMDEEGTEVYRCLQTGNSDPDPRAQ